MTCTKIQIVTLTTEVLVLIYTDGRGSIDSGRPADRLYTPYVLYGVSDAFFWVLKTQWQNKYNPFKVYKFLIV